MRLAILLCLLMPGLAQAAPDQEQLPPTEGYAYKPAGRRDPFLSLVGTGTVPSAHVKRADGPAGILVNEIALRGVLQSGAIHIAMIQAPNGRTYIIRPGEKFLDGVVKAITAEGLILQQHVTDPLSVEKQREVRKLLRSAEEPTR